MTPPNPSRAEDEVRAMALAKKEVELEMALRARGRHKSFTVAEAERYYVGTEALEADLRYVRAQRAKCEGTETDA